MMAISRITLVTTTGMMIVRETGIITRILKIVGARDDSKQVLCLYKVGWGLVRTQNVCKAPTPNIFGIGTPKIYSALGIVKVGVANQKVGMCVTPILWV